MISRIFHLAVFLAATGTALSAPWSEERQIEQFSPLLQRSPFNLPTAEESSPLAERFALTGAIEMDGENQIFVLDKTTLTRLRLGSQPGPLGLQLVEILPDPDPRKMRATIRMAGQTATISLAANTTAGAAPVKDGSAEKRPPQPQPAAAAAAPEQPKKPGRVVIRRAAISENPTPTK